VSPDGDHFLSMLSRSHSTLDRVSRQTYRLASLEFRPDTNRVWTLELSGAYGMQVYSLMSRALLDIRGLPDDITISGATWSPEGDQIAFLAHLPERTEVWLADVNSGTSASLADIAVNATISRGELAWTANGTVITLAVPPDRGPEPEESRVPSGPVIRTTREQETSTRTIPFLLEDAHDADLFEYYTTSQIVELAPGSEPRLIGEPAMYASISVSPDGNHLLTTRVTRPFSFITGWNSFPRKTEVLDLDGNLLAELIDEPLRESGGGRGGNGGSDPRELGWRVDGAGLTYLQREPRERGDEQEASGDAQGDSRGEAQEEEENGRADRVMLLAPPFDLDQAQVVLESEDALSNHSFSLGATRLFAGVNTDDGRVTATWDLTADSPEMNVLIEPFDDDDLLELPGSLMSRRAPNGISYTVVSTDGERVFLEGPGYAEDFRPTPFIDALDIADKSKERVFEGSKESHDSPLVALDDDMERIIVSRESRTEYPQSYLYSNGTYEQLTENESPYPELLDVQREHFTYERRDGVTIHGDVSMPVGYVEGTKVPAVFWTYPSEYTSVEDYERSLLRGTNLNRHPRLSFRSDSEVWLTQGYALVVPDIPIIGDPYNDKFVQHLVDSMYAAIRKVDEMGKIDIDKLGHGGHSYGAFTTGNILARSPFFKAGIAGDGAYNRSLTPTGFQRERRNIWEAPHIYIEMSPFFVADQIDTPMLMYHGMDDNNTGTWPIQSDRMIQALTSLGKTAVLYKYPYESHAPRALEQQLDLWARWIDWFDMFVKGEIDEETDTDAGPRGGR
jgi:dipeptidyl aminopeptidase/acylaminoacyl peptidase